MITKFKSINNLAVFRNFDWDSTIRDSGNNVALFKPINIFYGRNYSGKTTLSRIVRALETGNLSDKYENSAGARLQRVSIFFIICYTCRESSSFWFVVSS